MPGDEAPSGACLVDGMWSARADVSASSGRDESEVGSAVSLKAETVRLKSDGASFFDCDERKSSMRCRSSSV